MAYRQPADSDAQNWEASQPLADNPEAGDQQEVSAEWKDGLKFSCPGLVYKELRLLLKEKAKGKEKSIVWEGSAKEGNRVWVTTFNRKKGEELVLHWTIFERAEDKQHMRLQVVPKEWLSEGKIKSWIVSQAVKYANGELTKADMDANKAAWFAENDPGSKKRAAAKGKAKGQPKKKAPKVAAKGKAKPADEEEEEEVEEAPAEEEEEKPAMAAENGDESDKGADDVDDDDVDDDKPLVVNATQSIKPAEPAASSKTVQTPPRKPPAHAGPKKVANRATHMSRDDDLPGDSDSS